jgi:OmpA-OmpF porin, OOP family
MSFNLIDAAKSLFTNELVSKASAYLGESETGVSKAISGILPTVISSLANKTATNEGTAAIANMVNEQHNSGILGNLGSFFGNDSGSLLNKGAGLLNGLFGHKLDGITGLISNFSGLRTSSATSLLSMAVPALLGLIGKHSNGTGATGIASLLSSQKSNIAAAIPSGLNLSSVLGNLGGKVSDISADMKSTKEYYAKETETEKGGGMRFLLPLLLLVGAALLAWYLFGKGCGKTGDAIADGADTLKAKTEEVAADIKNTVVTTAGKLDSLTGDWNYDAGEMATIDLPNNGGALTVGKNSTEYRLISFLNDKDKAVDTVKGDWFEFTNVHFKKGGAELTDESMAQLKNMVAIAKAYPAAKFKFGGYTDNTGTDAINIPLSKKRADAVANMVTKLGAPKENITGAEGYGSQRPLQSNDTKEGQAQNRRVAVRVKAK